MENERPYIIDNKTLEDVYEDTIIEFFNRDKSLADLEHNVVSSVCADFFEKAVNMGFNKEDVFNFVKQEVYDII